jgi:WD40 repeat protein
MRIFDLPTTRWHPPDGLQFSPDGQFLAVQSRDRVDAFDTTTGKRWLVWQDEGESRHGTPQVGFTADSRGVVHLRKLVRHEGQGVYVHDLATGEDRVLRASNPVAWNNMGDVQYCATRADGKLVFVAVEPAARTTAIVALDSLTGETKFTFAHHRGYIRELAVSADGRSVVGCSSIDLRIWDIGDKLSNRAKWHFQDRSSGCFGGLALSADGNYLVAGVFMGHGARFRIWDVNTRKELDPGTPDGRLYGDGFSFAPDRPLLAYTRQVDNTDVVIFWDVAARTEVKRFDWKVGRVLATAFSPDGCRCATASQDKVVIWDVDL